MAKNPYTLVFGKDPSQVISRYAQASDIIVNFESDEPSQQIYLITGLRGCGKTVFMTEISNTLKRNDSEWIVVELSSSSDLLEDLAASLASENKLAKIFQNASIDLSLFGFGLEVKGSAPIANIQAALTKMLESLKKKNKKVLICIDEVIRSDHMVRFASVFQILVRQDLPVFLLMTGLYENINDLQNEKNLTFLYRAPRVALGPLNLGAISSNYEKMFNLDSSDALQMANLTKGYSFAFQVLGYFTWQKNGDYNSAIPEVKMYLEDYVYEKMWSEISAKDKLLAYGIARSSTNKAKEVKEIIGMNDNEYSTYRDRLKKRGLISCSEYGYSKLTLPFFDEYILTNYSPT